MSIPVNIEEIVGKRFGNLVIIKRSEFTKWQKTFCFCKCDCGNTKDVAIASLKTGNTTSCGCLKATQMSQRFKKHGLKSHILYGVWCGIKKRCFNKNCAQFKWYGGRGITVCDLWLNDFNEFYNWALENGYQQGLELDRTNNNGNYEPTNCRFVTSKINRNNASNIRKITYNGETKTMSEWADVTGVKHSVLYDRIHVLNQPLERAFINKRYNFNR